MNSFRIVLAFLFAIVIANPACCCAASPGDWTVAASSCCGGKEEKKSDPLACACLAKSPKKAEEPAALPVFKAIELPPVLQGSEVTALPPVPVRELPVPVDFYDTGPPLRRLTMLQRFLI